MYSSQVKRRYGDDDCSSGTFKSEMLLLLVFFFWSCRRVSSVDGLQISSAEVVGVQLVGRWVVGDKR
jgi:hypothetical protein